MKYIIQFFTLFLNIFLLFFFNQNYLLASNPASPDTSFALGTFNAAILDIKIQADGKMLLIGDFTYYKTTPAKHLIRLNTDGSVDNTFNIGSGANSGIYSIAIQSDGKIVVGGSFTIFNGISKYRIVRLNTDGSLDNTFDLSTTIIGGAMSIAIQADGKILVAGLSANKIARLNTDGSLDNTFNPGSGANSDIYSLALQADGKILLGGNFTSFNGYLKNRIVRLNSSGSVDNTFNIGTGADAYVKTITVQADGKILLGGVFIIFNGASQNRIVRLNTDGSIDNTFITGTGASYLVYSIYVQPDGKVLVGGGFSSFNGVLSKKYLVRLNNNGSIDNDFTIGSGPGNTVNSIAIQLDGKIVVGGNFNSFNGLSHNRLARLSSNGILESTFNSSAGANDFVFTLSVQANGKIIAGGSFLSFNGVPIPRLVRLNSDGEVDNTFNIGTGPNEKVFSTATQSDGKILVGGMFTTFNGISKNYIVRLNPDGTVDNTFNIGSGASATINSIVVQADGKILAGGEFLNFNGFSKAGIIRLNQDGTIDNTFNIGSGASGGYVKTIAVQPDGKIIIGGSFTALNGITQNRLARLNVDGSLDITFNIGSGPSFSPYAMNVVVLQKDGKIVVGGRFTTFNDIPKNHLVRLNADGSVDNTFNIGSGANIPPLTIAIQADGKLLVGGDFTTFNDFPRMRIVRLNTDGSVDSTFDVGSGIDVYVFSLAILRDAKILMAGYFSVFNGVAYNNIIRFQGNAFHNTIHGNIFTDNNNDCAIQPSENRISSILVKALPGPFYGGSDANGNFQLKVDSGSVNYALTLHNNSIFSKLLVNQCTPSYNVVLTGDSKDTCCFNFSNSVKECALLNIDIQNTRMRRCFKNSTFVNYCNYGNASASGAQIRIVYPSYVKPISSVPMWTSKQDSVLIYDIGAIQKNFCGKITILDSVICGDETIRGLTQCIKATISPASNCESENPAWDKSSMKVTGSCKIGNAVFTIVNAGSGNMISTHEYRVYVNDTLIFTGTFQLNSGEFFNVTYPAQGQTIRLEADQHPLHPGKSRPRATVEDCGTPTQSTPVTGLVTTAPQDDMDEETAITCNMIIDSYDPNDKQAMPAGIGSTKRISPGEEIEYIIRFQNTGTDTAYNVSVVDTLDIALDAGSFTQGVSSHPYSLEISGKNQAVLSFTFNNIKLPDSTVNKSGSNGLVSFRIHVPSSSALGTIIKNKAHIFFDFNSAIITNETIHTVDNAEYTDLTKGNLVQVGQVITGVNKKINGLVKIYPNPSLGVILVEIPEYGNKMELRVMSVLGLPLKTIQLNSTVLQEVNLEGIKQGVYLYEILDDDERIAGGLLQLN